MAPTGSKRTIGICGAGQMGAAGAVCFRRAGYPVILWARNPQKLPAIRETLARLEAWLDRNAISQSSAFACHPERSEGPRRPGCEGRGRRQPPKQTEVLRSAQDDTPGKNAGIDLTSDLALLDARAEVIVDCIAEDMAEKVKLFRRPRPRARLYLTTTSGLSITALGRRSGTGPRLVGTHFWNPPHLMPLVEVVRGRDTSEAVMRQAIALVRSIDKIPVRVEKDVPGFIGNRLLHALWREAIYLVQRGIASPADVDRVARLTFGLRLPAVGPLENMDIVGLPLIETIHQYLLADLADAHQPLPLLRRLRKTGRNFHNRSPRELRQLIERRDQQIVHQLQFLRELKAL